ncbi:MAG: hypothetical protein OXD43_10010 [Bacteroidetes bacterium]|nr:hypothetical protein [Bacteroidota bacterium]
MGTNSGLWETLDEEETWTRQNRVLPNVPITRINLTHDWKEILVATFGRGLFTVPATAVDVALVSSTSRAEFPEPVRQRYEAAVRHRKTRACASGRVWCAEAPGCDGYGPVL